MRQARLAAKNEHVGTLLQHCVVVTPQSGKLLLRAVANGALFNQFCINSNRTAIGKWVAYQALERILLTLGHAGSKGREPLSEEQ